jgi:hypothetical protein
VTPVVFIGFCKGKGVLSRIIEWASGGGPSHAFLVYQSQELGWIAISAEARGLLVLPAEAMENVCGLYYFPGEAGVLLSGIQKNRQWLGAPYDIGGLLGMGWVEVCWHWIKRRVKNPLDSKSAWFCSEFTAKVAADSGKKLDLPVGQTDPLHLEDEIVSCGAVSTRLPCVPVRWA